MSDYQSGADAVVEIVESLIAESEYDSIRAILESFNPTRHPVPVGLALLSPIVREGLWPDSRRAACKRMIAHLRATGREGVVPLVETWAK